MVLDLFVRGDINFMIVTPSMSNGIDIKNLTTVACWRAPYGERAVATFVQEAGRVMHSACHTNSSSSNTTPKAPSGGSVFVLIDVRRGRYDELRHEFFTKRQIDFDLRTMHAYTPDEIAMKKIMQGLPLQVPFLPPIYLNGFVVCIRPSSKPCVHHHHQHNPSQLCTSRSSSLMWKKRQRLVSLLSASTSPRRRRLLPRL